MEKENKTKAKVELEGENKENGAKVEEKPKKQMVEVSKDDLENLLKKLEKQEKDINLLYQAADKGRLSKAMNDGSQTLIRTFKVSTWDNTGKIVTGWTLTSNRCEVVLGRWIEEQTVNVLLEDGEVVAATLLEFYRKTIKKIVGDLTSSVEEKDNAGNKVTLYNLELKDGRKIKINSVFVN